MASLVSRAAQWCFRRRRTVIAVWLVLLIVGGVGAATLESEPEDSFEIPGSESMEAIDLVEERYPGVVIGASARVVLAAEDGRTLTDRHLRDAVADVVGAVADAPDVVGVADPFESGNVSADGRIAYIDVDYSTESPRSAADALDEAAAPARDAGLTVEFAGLALEEAEDELVSGVELVGLAVAAVVLIVTFGSLVAAGMPLLNAVVGVALTVFVITIAGRFIDLSSSTLTLALMLGLAVAIDYALFILSRYRSELRTGRERERAIGRAAGTAGSAVVFAGLITIVALSGMWVVGIPTYTEMGFAAAVAIAVAVVVALTLLPALCGVAGRRIERGRRTAAAAASGTTGQGSTLSRRWAQLVTGRPTLVLAVAVVVLPVLAVPALSMRFALPDDSTAPAGSTQRSAYDLVAEGFGPGMNGPLMVVVDAAGARDPQGVAAETERMVRTLEDVAQVAAPTFNPAGDTALITIVPETAPTAPETEDLVAEIRSRGESIGADGGANVSVTGVTAVLIDFTTTMRDALPVYLGLVVGLSLLILVVMFRSILVPIKAALGFLLTIGATFGALVAVFQWGWLSGLLGIEQPGPIGSILPIFLVAVTFGLAMDYQIFLVTRMHEEHVRGADPTGAVVAGFEHGGRVVAAAATIMISVFAGFVLSSDDLVKQIGFALAVAIAVDAFVVRMTLVPAAMTLLGSRSWWLPRWVNRLLPGSGIAQLRG